ncbi:hypothetical protein [Amycolatopsis sp. La24]|uniref:hypothetical protein n=1 Tax=Amycolatopsis sp. La24 TaxID=3028304 RepID=UPI0023B0A9E1|nr:hypothetical protein [Amycolatopsis sp. La24]
MTQRDADFGVGPTLPVSFDVATVTDNMLARGEVLSSVEVDAALLQLPRADGPLLLAFAHLHSLITAADLARTIGEAWAMAEYPDRQLGHEIWRTLFAVAGYTDDGHPVPRPERPLRLFRGAVVERRGDWSWTDNQNTARLYAAGGLRGRPVGQVWTALVEPARLLARNTGRDESEYVVDTKGLRIAESAPA